MNEAHSELVLAPNTPPGGFLPFGPLALLAVLTGAACSHPEASARVALPGSCSVTFLTPTL